MKRLIAIVIALALGMAVLTGCKNTPESENASSNKDINNTEEFSGRFSGPAGFMEFATNGEVQINFSDEHVWDLYPPSFNMSHLYQFVTGEKEIVPYYRAEKLVLLNIKDGKYFYTLPCRVEESRIVLYPGEGFETVFEKEAQ